MSLELNITGTIVSIEEETLRGQYKGIKFVLKVPNERNAEYPDFLQIEIGNKDDAKYDNVQNLQDRKYQDVGDLVTCELNVGGRQWLNPDKKKNPDGKLSTFNSIKCWKMSNATEAAPDTGQSAGEAFDEEDDEDCPF